jgi:hypothetical protein
LRQLRHVSNLIFTLALVPLIRSIAGSCGIRDDGADGVVEYADSSHGARPASRTRDGGVFDDVYGDGADGRAVIRLVSGPPWAIGGVGAIVGAALFARNLPKIRVEARELIIAQGMAGGEPAQEVTARSAP